MFRRFLSELKRRRVIRVAGVYAVTCWALFQVVNSLFPALHLPAWTVTLTAVLLILGFPIALIVAWAFEPASDGVRLTPAPPKDAPLSRLAWSDWALVAVAVAIVGLTVTQMTGVTRGLSLGRPGAVAVAHKSVAVLPFANFSSEKDAELFADGLTEEVINSLAQIPDLKVAGRTSAFYFKGRNDDLRLIGAKLGVSHVLEGSVRQEGERLRVTVQLIKVEDGFHVWSNTYDRRMDDAFAIQTEIAGKVADVLKVKLEMDPARRPAVDPDAYGAVLVARAQVRKLGLDELTQARATFKRLIDQGQANTGAYAGYAQATILLAQNYLALDFNEADAESKRAIDKALSLDPQSPEALVARGTRCIIRTIRLGDQACVAEAGVAYATAERLAPRDPDVLVGYANYLIKRHDPAQAAERLERALNVDPLNRVALMLAADAQSMLGRYEAAETGYRRVIELYPDFVDAKQSMSDTLVAKGRLDEAEPWARAAAAAGTDPSATIQLARIYLSLGMTREFNATLDGMKSPQVVADLAQALRFITAEDFIRARAFMDERLRTTHDPLWLSGRAHMAVLTGDYEAARADLIKIAPDLFTPAPKVDPALAEEAVTTAFVFDRQGDHAQARRVLTALLAATAPRAGVIPSHEVAIVRVQAWAILGDKARALAELRQAIGRGYRMLWDLEAFIRLERQPGLAVLKDDPQFQAMVREVEADNAKMRQALIAKRAI
jgi:TolB-like protein/tetratricopeptide (TPR) repeat protein